MKSILITGRGGVKSGSWQIRGVQLGKAMGACVEPLFMGGAKYDVAVIVKRARLMTLNALQEMPVVWDVVDSWPQPDGVGGNVWTRERCMDWLRDEIAVIRPRALVAATRTMATDCAVFGLPVLALPHHARPDVRRNHIREHVARVGYEGGEQYLRNGWRSVLESACAERGWEFVCNPAELADVDIVVAVRDSCGYAPLHWKSNVKLANAQGSGTPCIVARERGYIETASGGELWADTPAEMCARLDELRSHAVRVAAADDLHRGTIGLAAVARIYRTWLELLRF